MTFHQQNNNTSYSTPSYDLAKIKKLLSNPQTRFITRQAYSTAFGLGYTGDSEIIKRVILVTSAEFYKTMPAKKIPDLMQDVYRSKTTTDELYIKFQINLKGDGILIQFKEL